MLVLTTEYCWHQIASGSVDFQAFNDPSATESSNPQLPLTYASSLAPGDGDEGTGPCEKKYSMIAATSTGISTCRTRSDAATTSGSDAGSIPASSAL